MEVSSTSIKLSRWFRLDIPVLINGDVGEMLKTVQSSFSFQQLVCLFCHRVPILVSAFAWLCWNIIFEQKCFSCFESQIRDWILLPLVTPKRGVLCVIFILQFETWPISLSLEFYVLYYRNYLFSTKQIKKILNKFWIVESFDTTVSICHLSSSCMFHLIIN